MTLSVKNEPPENRTLKTAKTPEILDFLGVLWYNNEGGRNATGAHLKRWRLLLSLTEGDFFAPSEYIEEGVVPMIFQKHLCLSWLLTKRFSRSVRYLSRLQLCSSGANKTKKITAQMLTTLRLSF